MSLFSVLSAGLWCFSHFLVLYLPAPDSRSILTPSMASYYFTIIGTQDNPLYELEFSSFKSSPAGGFSGQSQFSPKVKELLPFITNLSLDLVEDAQWGGSASYLGKIDSFYGLSVNAFITQGNIKLILCHDGAKELGGAGRDDSVIKLFFFEAYDLYVKALLNPFYSVNDPLVLPDFDYRLKLLARKHL